MQHVPKNIQGYFDSISLGVDSAYNIANDARKQGHDPEKKVDIPLAKNMAERVEGLISVVAPQLVGKGMIKRIHKLEQQYSPLDWRVGFKIAEEVAKQELCKFETQREAMEVGIRAGFSYLTAGIVSAPLEGFIELRLKPREDGKEYFSVCYAGPIRGAGGTAAALSVILADYVRVKMGYAKYDPTQLEIQRYVTEVYDYHERAVNLQYLPSVEEISYLAKHIPVEINGDPTEKLEVSNYKDLPRVETNRIRGGVCLVLAEGIAQKAPKLWKRLVEWGEEMGIDWKFLEIFLLLQRKIKSKTQPQEKDSKPKITANYTFISDLVAGRPVLTEPLGKGGFRLRYGRSRTTGFSAAGVNPATMYILNRYIATGTQLKIERPGKAAAVTPCLSIEGPIVRLKDGSVLQLDSIQKAKQCSEEVDEILFLGDILINYGDFSENVHPLVPAGYCAEWWVQEVEKGVVDCFGSLDYEKLSGHVNLPEEELKLFFDPSIKKTPSFHVALTLSEKLNVPLHPNYVFYWDAISKEQLSLLLDWFKKAKIDYNGNYPQKIILPKNPEAKRALEEAGIPHLFVNNEYVVIQKPYAPALWLQLGGANGIPKTIIEYETGAQTALDIITKFSPVRIRPKSGTFIGARMGRPEKAKQRKLTGSPHVLFPVGEEGGRLRSFQEALQQGKVKSHFPIFRCKNCNKETIYTLCEICGKHALQMYYCKSCGVIDKKDCRQHGECSTYMVQEIDIQHYFKYALKKLDLKIYPELIKGVRGTSNKDHMPENLAKGILRSVNSVYVNKDGTTRFDMSELPITHFKPAEIHTPINKLKELGYSYDVYGKELSNPHQLLEIFPQDLILPASKEALDEQADRVLLRVAQYVDDLLEKFYGMDKFYNLESRDSLIGHLVIGLAPHISAGIIGRIIGFSETQALFAHPFFHAAMRRDADGDEACVILLMDALLNFSRCFLPNKRGSRTMDSPLVLTSYILPSEIDDQAHGIDVVWRYPLEFYQAALEYKMPWEVEIEQVKHRLTTEKQYLGIGFTHDAPDINHGVNCSAYKSLPSMEEKLKGQMDIARKIRAVSEPTVARYVIEKHFLKDIKGNLKKFSMQQFRCVKCNEKFRRPPLIGKCSSCGGKIIFTISEGSVTKYLGPSISLAKKYDVPAYLKQTLEILERGIEANFGKDKEKQEGLGRWFG